MNNFTPIPPVSVSTLPRSGPHVLIVGGGASGVMMAAQLLSRTEAGYRVTIIEGRHMLGCGIAYSTTDPDHLLNTRAHNMSAFPDRPRHFMDWLGDRPEGTDITDQCFVSRATYGAYMAGLLAPWSGGSADRRLRCVMQTCLRLRETATGVAATLEDGQTLIGDMAVLATGHAQPVPEPGAALTGPRSAQQPVDPDDRIVIVGTGLTMVDCVLSLVKSGHRGQILSISRRGLLPRGHARTAPLPVSIADLPLGAPMSALTAWLRGLARETERRGGTWRDAVDGVRPHVRRIWRALPPAERDRFLRHGATWWDVHRHRIPTASAKVIARVLDSGQLLLRRGHVTSAEIGGDGRPGITLRPHGAQKTFRLSAGRVIDCRGIRRDPEHNATPLVADLLATGQARVDPLRIGLDVTGDCQLVARDGRPSRRIFAIGPASRAAFWEITAIPDIRDQVARLSGATAAQVVAPRTRSLVSRERETGQAAG